ncbi:MAG: hypothetical protein JRF47_17010 [Deltaproteobacteria bacterium]|nr:hypothetical protein [Deltaproteobacteria bacterium]
MAEQTLLLGAMSSNVQYLHPLTPETLYETPPGRNNEQIERRTSNAQHRTSNIDDATLYLF